jgi:hypothetical protein
MNRLVSVALLLSLFVPAAARSAWIDDEKKPEQDKSAQTPEESWRALQQDWMRAQQEFSKVYQSAKTNEERQKVLQEKRPNPKPFLERALKLAQTHADSPIATDALLWSLQYGSGTDAGKKAQELLIQGFITKAKLSEIAAKLQRVRVYQAAPLLEAVVKRVESNLNEKGAAPLLAWVQSHSMFGPDRSVDRAGQLLLDKFINDDALAVVCQTLGNSEKPENIAKLRAVRDQTTNKKVRASATFGMAMLLKEQDDHQKEAETLFQAIADDPAPDDKAIVAKANAELREMKLFGLGKTIPELEGEDLQDKKFKLSDYRGKVVLLDFWGFW